MPMDPEKKAEAVARIQEAARVAFGRGLRTILVHGSALTEDFVPGYSDLDVHIYVSPVFLRADRVPELEPAVDFQRALGALDPREYGVHAFQLIFLDAEQFPADWQKPLPGSYEVVYGGPVDDRAPLGERLRVAHAQLEGYRDHAASLVSKFVDKPDVALPRMVRLAGTFLKGAIHSAALVATGRPGALTGRGLDELLETVREAGADTSGASAFFEAVREWDRLREDPEGCRRAFTNAIRAMDALVEWHEGLAPRRRRPASEGRNPRMGR